MDLQDEKSLEEMKHNHRCYQQANQAAIDNGTKALNALFLLNGAAATALLTQKDHRELQYTAGIFAFAALCSIFALGASHLFNLINSETWLLPAPEKDDDPWIPLRLFKRSISRNQLDTLRAWLLAFCCVPAVLFLVGLVVAALVI